MSFGTGIIAPHLDWRRCRKVSHEESLDLIATIRRGEGKNASAEVRAKASRARARLAEGYLPLVPHILKRYLKHCRDPQGLIAEGNLGLVKAIDKFDPKRGSFTTCAWQWIRAYGQRFAIENHSIVRFTWRQGWQERTDLAFDAYSHGDDGDSPMTMADLMLVDLGPNPEELVAAAELDAQVRQVRRRTGQKLGARSIDIIANMGQDTPLSLRKLGERHGVSHARMSVLQARAMASLRLGLSLAGIVEQ